jgi:hypothetical protein
LKIKLIDGSHIDFCFPLEHKSTMFLLKIYCCSAIFPLRRKF